MSSPQSILTPGSLTPYQKATPISPTFSTVIEIAKEVASILGTNYGVRVYKNAFQVELEAREIEFEQRQHSFLFYKGSTIGSKTPSNIFIIDHHYIQIETGERSTRELIYELGTLMVKKEIDKGMIVLFRPNRYTPTFINILEDDLKAIRHYLD